MLSYLFIQDYRLEYLYIHFIDYNYMLFGKFTISLLGPALLWKLRQCCIVTGLRRLLFDFENLEGYGYRNLKARFTPGPMIAGIGSATDLYKICQKTDGQAQQFVYLKRIVFTEQCSVIKLQQTTSRDYFNHIQQSPYGTNAIDKTIYFNNSCRHNIWASLKNRLTSKLLSLIHIQMCIRDRYSFVNMNQ